MNSTDNKINLSTAEHFLKNRYQSDESEDIAKRLKIVSDLIAKTAPKGAKICDVGCNEGKLGKLLIPQGYEVHGIDISMKVLEKAKHNQVKTYALNIETEQFPFEDNYFEAVVSADTLVCIYDTTRVVKEIHRVLKPGGTFIVTTANVLSLPRRLLYLFGIGAFLESDLDGDNSGTIRFFTQKSLKDFIEKNGFKAQFMTSDYVTLSPNGNFKSETLAKLFPTFGACNIISSVKV
ncbi:MAG: class I SAM-dependent methyltransferase [Oligoflexales bacterium]|nr:class I SAM-dependent methyltransferase [Oligoflexales bacterium]